MATEPTNPHPSTLKTDPRALWGRPLAVAAAVVFLVSSAFPVVAGLSKNTASFPKWWGTLDVGIAFVLAFLAIALMALAEGRVTSQARDDSYRAYRILIHGTFALLVAFFLFGDRIVWINCLTGFAWRSWLLMYGLPAWFTAFSATPGPGNGSGKLDDRDAGPGRGAGGRPGRLDAENRCRPGREPDHAADVRLVHRGRES